MRTGMHTQAPLLRTPRGRHILEGLLVGALAIVAGLGLAYVLSQRIAPPRAAVSSQPWMGQLREFKEQQAEARGAVAAPVIVRAPQLSWVEFKDQQAEARGAVAAPAIVRAPQLSWMEFKDQQAEAREAVGVPAPTLTPMERWIEFKDQQAELRAGGH